MVLTFGVIANKLLDTCHALAACSFKLPTFISPLHIQFLSVAQLLLASSRPAYCPLRLQYTNDEPHYAAQVDARQHQKVASSRPSSMLEKAGQTMIHDRDRDMPPLEIQQRAMAIPCRAVESRVTVEKTPTSAGSFSRLLFYRTLLSAQFLCTMRIDARFEISILKQCQPNIYGLRLAEFEHVPHSDDGDTRLVPPKQSHRLDSFAGARR
jgi:hypothetical protein